MIPKTHSANTVDAVKIRISKLPPILYGCVAFFTLISLVIVYLRFTRFSGTEVETILARFLGTDYEGNLPTYFSSIMLLLSGLLAGAIGICSGGEDRRVMRYWLGLGVVLMLMSIDEMCGMHDFINDNLPALIQSQGIELPTWLIWPWVILGALFALTMLWLYLPFVFALPKRTRNMIILSGAVFVTGAVGFETLGGAFKSMHGPGLGTALLSAVEEFLEMLGVAILIQALLEHLANSFPVVTVKLDLANQPRQSRVESSLRQVIKSANLRARE